jgi:hypothetical protein
MIDTEAPMGICLWTAITVGFAMFVLVVGGFLLKSAAGVSSGLIAACIVHRVMKENE